MLRWVPRFESLKNLRDPALVGYALGLAGHLKTVVSANCLEVQQEPTPVLYCR